MDCPPVRCPKEIENSSSTVWYNHFLKRNNVPFKMAFEKRLVDRFEMTGNTSSASKLNGNNRKSPRKFSRVKTGGQNDVYTRIGSALIFNVVKTFKENRQSISVPTIATHLYAPTATFWRVLYMNLRAELLGQIFLCHCSTLKLGWAGVSSCLKPVLAFFEGHFRRNIVPLQKVSSKCQMSYATSLAIKHFI